MNEDKKTFLLQMITQLEEELITMSTKLEDNENIKDQDFEKYDKAIDGLHKLLSNLKDEVYYS